MVDELVDALVKEKQDELSRKTEDLLRAKAGEEVKEMTPLEEMRTLQAKLPQTLAEMKSIADRFELNLAQAQLGGRSFAGQAPPKKKTPEEEARERGSNLVERWFAK